MAPVERPTSPATKHRPGAGLGLPFEVDDFDGNADSLTDKLRRIEAVEQLVGDADDGGVRSALFGMRCG